MLLTLQFAMKLRMPETLRPLFPNLDRLEARLVCKCTLCLVDTDADTTRVIIIVKDSFDFPLATRTLGD